MIEATCAACGTLNRIAESDVPLGAKFVNCASCKSRVVLPAKTASGGALPKVPPATSPGPAKGPGIPSIPIPTIPSIPLGPSGAGKGPALPSKLPAVPAKPPGAPAKPTDGIIDLADLPAPKRQSALGPEASKPAPKSALGPEASKPAPRSGLSAGFDAELPAPKSARPAGPPPAALELDDLLGGGDALGPPGIVDLPAPKGAVRAMTPRPITDAPPFELADLPAPKAGAGRGLADLPTPKTPPRAPSDLGVPKSSAAIIDLPTPKAGGNRAITDLPMPKGPSGISDLPTPKGPSGISDLPTPKGPSGISDLPMPKAGGLSDLPTPKPGAPTDQLTPKVPGGIDLPAPKGFFDDLPQPAPAASQNRAADLPAPKGFFDDLPQPALTKATNDIAPKGFFDDLPQRANPNKSSMDLTPSETNPSTVLAPANASLDVAPKGFFDDLPQPRGRVDTAAPSVELGASLDHALDLAGDVPALDLGDGPALDLDDGPSLDLGDPPASEPSRGQFDDLDLSKPSTSPVRFETPQRRAATSGGTAQGPLPPVGVNRSSGDGALELEEPRLTTSSTERLAPKRKEKPVTKAPDPRARKQRTRMLAGIVLGLAVLGGGGFVMYQRHAAAQAREEEIAVQLGTARKALTAEDANHWQRAAAAASEVLEADPTNAEALGIGAEASFASGLADGKGAAMKFGKGRKMISDALGAGITGSAIERAQALSAITSVPANAVPKLEALIAKSPKDGTLALYLGWAQAAKGDAAAAIKSFDQALAGSPAIKIHALYGRARAKLVLADVEGAKADFAAVLDLSKEHIPAMVGLAAALPEAQAQQQESDLLAILARKDIATADPRAVVQAWVLAGDDARRGSRFDAARERYRKALAIEPKDISAMTGLSEVELLDKKIDAAAELITKALTQSPDDARAQLVASEISLRQGKLDDADARLKALAARTPPLPPLDLARLHVVSGRLRELKGDDQGAVDEFIAGAKLAGDLDLTPTMAAVAKLSKMSKDATDANNVKLATELRDRADQLLGSLADKANNDPQLAMTLGMAYQQAGDPAKAEPWLRRVIDARPKDPDAMYQLGKALTKLGKSGDAVEYLKKAMELAADRGEIGLELARTYDALHLSTEATQLYIKLLAAPEPSLELRTHAGRFFARTGQLDKAAEQGAKILEADRRNPAGNYLKAEGLLADDKFDDARKLFTEAATADQDPQYLDGQGRATERLSQLRNDVALQEAALRAYVAAHELAPKMFNPLAGMGRLYIARREAGKALEALVDAQKIMPDDPEVLLNIGIALQELDRKPEAIGFLLRANALRPKAEAGYRLGQMYTDLNKPGQAISSLSSATRLGLEEEKKTGVPIAWMTDGLYRLGRVAFDSHDEATARAAWEKYVARNPPPPPGAQLDEVKRLLLTSLKR